VHGIGQASCNWIIYIINLSRLCCLSTVVASWNKFPKYWTQSTAGWTTIEGNLHGWCRTSWHHGC
jgi:hypothetical protein